MWGGFDGLLIPYYSVDTANTDRSRVEIFGADLATGQIVFHVFADTQAVWPYAGALAGSDPQCTQTTSAVPHMDQGHLSAGEPPVEPPVEGGGTYPKDPPPCLIDAILNEAANRVCQPVVLPLPPNPVSFPM